MWHATPLSLQSKAGDYPTNCVVLLNGTRDYVIDKRVKDGLAYTMLGYVSESEYEVMVNDTGKTPTKFVSYNDPNVFFPFWSSPSYTYAVAMLVLGRYDKLQKEGDLASHD